MTLQSSGAISLSQVKTELGIGAATEISMNDTRPRGLAGITTNASTIAMSNFYGKADKFVMYYNVWPTSQFNNVWYDRKVRVDAVAEGWDQNQRLQIVVGQVNNPTPDEAHLKTLVNHPITYLPETRVLQPFMAGYRTKTWDTAGGGTVKANKESWNQPGALYISGSFPNGMELWNYGYIIGCGGAGASFQGSSGFDGQPAIAVDGGVNLTIYNYGVIGGGGGGGGSGARGDRTNQAGNGGGGAGIWGEYGYSGGWNSTFPRGATWPIGIYYGGAGNTGYYQYIGPDGYGHGGGSGGNLGMNGSPGGGGGYPGGLGGAAVAATGTGNTLTWGHLGGYIRGGQKGFS